MDILGGIITFLALGILPMLGIHRFLGQAQGNVTTSGNVMWTQLKTKYVATAAQQVTRYLGACVVIHLSILFAAYNMAEQMPWIVFRILVATTVVAVVGEVLLIIWQLPAIPRRTSERYPEYMKNDAGHLLGQDGRPLRINGQPVTLHLNIPTDANGNEVSHELLLRHPFAGQRERNDAAFRPERLETGGSLLLTVAMFLINGGVMVWLAGTLESVPLLFLYAVNMVMALIPLKIGSALVAWALERGISLVEFAGSLGIRQILPLAIGVTVQNSPRLEIADQEAIKRTIKTYAAAIVQNVLIISLWMLIATSTQTLTIVPMVIIMIVIPSMLFSMAGGEVIVKERHYRLMKWHSIVAPIVGIPTVAYRYLPNTGMGSDIKLFILEKWHELFYGVVLGTRPLSVGGGWTVFFLLGFSGIIALFIFSKVKGAEKGTLKTFGTFTAAVATLFALFYAVELGHVIAGKETMHVPWGVSDGLAQELEEKREALRLEKRVGLQQAQQTEEAWDATTRQASATSRIKPTSGETFVQSTHETVRIVMPSTWKLPFPEPEEETPPPPATEEDVDEAPTKASPTRSFKKSRPTTPREEYSDVQKKADYALFDNYLSE